jgi:hypothetical protein
MTSASLPLLRREFITLLGGKRPRGRCAAEQRIGEI